MMLPHYRALIGITSEFWIFAFYPIMCEAIVHA